MADIRIQKKRPIWPWVAMVIAGIFIIWIIVRVFDREQRMANIEDPAPADEHALHEPFVPEEVQAFLTFVQEKEAGQDMGPVHAYTANGIKHLTNAMEALSRSANVEGISYGERRRQLYRRANFLQEDPAALTHSDTLRRALLNASAWMEHMQRQRFPGREYEVSRVRAAAEAVEPEQTLLDQRDQIDSFFYRAGEAIRLMAFDEEDEVV
ncbi:MAG: hypothetical protein ACK4ND_10940 [Cytophagaceae bacterium]